jgi:ribosomal RNA assembly protein
MTTHVKVPKERVAVLIGPKGEVKRYIEDRAGVTLDVDSKDGSVVVHEEGAEDPFIAMRAAEIVKAIGRGFSPEHAFALLRDDFYFNLMNITEYVGKKPTHVRRIRARLIGTEGKTRRLIEELSECYITVYGNTVGIIGDDWGSDVARRAIDMVLSGSEHRSVYGFLEKMRRAKRMAQLDGIR